MASLVPEGEARESALLVIISNHLCCSAPRKVETTTHHKWGPFRGPLLFRHLVAFVPLPLTLHRNDWCALDSNFAAISSKSKPLGTPDLPATSLSPSRQRQIHAGTLMA